MLVCEVNSGQANVSEIMQKENISNYLNWRKTPSGIGSEVNRNVPALCFLLKKCQSEITNADGMNIFMANAVCGERRTTTTLTGKLAKREQKPNKKRLIA